MLKSTNCLSRSNNMGAGCLFIQTGANLLDNDKMAVLRDAIRYQIACFFYKVYKKGEGSFPFIEIYNGKFCIFWRALAT